MGSPCESGWDYGRHLFCDVDGMPVIVLQNVSEPPPHLLPGGGIPQLPAEHGDALSVLRLRQSNRGLKAIRALVCQLRPPQMRSCLHRCV